MNPAERWLRRIVRDELVRESEIAARDAKSLALKVECVQAEAEDLARLMKSQRDLLNGLREQLHRFGERVDHWIDGAALGAMCFGGCRLGELSGSGVSHETSPSVGDLSTPTVGDGQVAGESTSSSSATEAASAPRRSKRRSA